MKNYLRFIIILTFALISVNTVFSQSRTELERRRTETIDKINYTNQLIEKTKKSQRDSYNNLLLINNKINSRRQLIEHIRLEIRIVENRIKENENIISSLEDDLKKMKDDYAEMIRIAWKNKSTLNNLMFLLSSESFNQTYLRFKHMQQLSAYRQKQFEAINYVQHVLNAHVQRLHQTRLIKQELLAEEQAESQSLQREQNQQRQTLNRLQQEEEKLRKELKEQEQQAERLQREIQRLIAEEAKRTSGSATGVYQLTPAEQIISTNFGNNRGKLPWPVERGIVVSNFGKQRHPVLRNIEIDNRGIDIATTEGAIAKSIFDGEVRRVISLPGAHNAVIIRHGEYLSVYTNLESVLVSIGEQVSTNQPIGKIHTDKSENKTIIHLEIWKQNTTLNPALWLSK